MSNVSLLGTGVTAPSTSVAAALAAPVAATALSTDITWLQNALARRLATLMNAANWAFIYNPEVPLYDTSVKRSGACLFTGPAGLPWNTEGRNFQAGNPFNGIVAADRLFAVSHYLSDANPAGTKDAGGVTLGRCWEYERDGYYGEDFTVPVAAINSNGYTAGLTSFWTVVMALPAMLSAEADLVEQAAKSIMRGPNVTAARAQALLGLASQAKAIANQLSGRRAAMLPLPLIGRRLMMSSGDAAVAESIEATAKAAASLR